ncbi:MAG: SDR family oxidoreductase [Clostridiales bacterium]|nr:SDR family oxidoreductase [Eubacteriales bacterium]MDH7567671.1 SDR family oxidoreductase [Clostridiales bacterium]
MGGKVILITGGSRGLGSKLVKRLSAENENTVYFTYLNSEKKAAELAAQFNNVTALKCDQRSESQIIDCVSKIDSLHGRLDVLVNNACNSFKPCELLSTDWAAFQDCFDVNVKGAYFFTREAAKIMKRQGAGKIINVLSSYVLNVPPEKLSFYITAKYALLGISRAAAVELGKWGVTVNMISPGLMATDLSGHLPKKYFDMQAQKHPMKRMASTDDAADVVEFLISDKAKFLNGTNIPVNGGEVFL